MDSPEKVIPDNKGVASVMLRYFGDKAWFIVLERITGDRKSTRLNSSHRT